MDILTTVELWQIMESTFIRQRNITFDRYILFTTKQSKEESIEHFFGKLKELSENCDLGNQEDTLIRDLFIANIQDPEIQRELLRETVEPPHALRLAINMELGQRNQLQISNTQPASHVYAIIPQRPFRQSIQRQYTSAPIRQTNQLCRNCGLTWSAKTGIKVLRKAIRAIVVVYRITFHVYVVSRSPHPLNQLVLMLTQLRTIQLNSRSMRSKMPIIILNVNPTMVVQMIIQ